MLLIPPVSVLSHGTKAHEGVVRVVKVRRKWLVF
jgi:hypothetical protein